VAILLVILDHADIKGFDDAGGVGVTLFFTLSGYLITGQLLAEYRRRGGIDLRAFYGRRARRLLPALYLMLGTLLLLGGAAAIPSIVITVLELANLPASGDSTALYGPLHHMWSLAVEEQFYLLWPALLIVLLDVPALRKRLVVVVAALMSVALLFRTAGYVAWGYNWAYHATIPNTYPLLAGAAMAVVFGLSRQSLPRWWGSLGLLAVVAAATAPLPGGNGWILARTIVVVPFALLPLLGGSSPLLTNAPLRFAGRVSYGWYLWHVLLQVMFGGIIGSLVSLGVAAASWQWWERPWLTARRPDTRRSPVENPPPKAALAVE
jgi:peptidoglycan/LPS O-acetylase OafA/YrhL